MRIYIEGGPITVNEALNKVVDDNFWINGTALKLFVGRQLHNYYRITLTQRKRWWSGTVVQIIKTVDALGHVDYYSKEVLTKEK